MEVERLNVKFKRKYTDNIKKTVIAFANSSGGTIYIGVEDNGNVLGVENSDDTILKVTNSIRDCIKPDVTLFTTCKIKVIDNKKIITVKVQKGTACPYYLFNKGIRPEGVYIRQGASSVPATESTIIKMIKEMDGNNYEDLRLLKQKLNFKSLKHEFNEANISLDKSKMKTLHIVGEDDLYTNMGLLLSEECIHTIKIAIFEGSTKGIFKDRYEFSGSLLKQLREVYAFIDRYNQTRSEFEGLKRIYNREYTISAIREAILNSLVYIDYS